MSTASKARLLGYVRVENKDDIYVSPQDAGLHDCSNKLNLDLVRITHDVSNGVQIMRLGLWKALRMMACLDCEAKSMPMSLDYDLWFREAMRPCSCSRPDSVNGLIVSDIPIICTTPSLGSKFILDFCWHKKHLYSAREKRCLSCCNPQAIEVLRKKTLSEAEGLKKPGA